MIRTKIPFWAVFLIAVLMLGPLGCATATPRTKTPPPQPTQAQGNDPQALKVAFTAEMMPFASEMAKRFNAGRAGQVKVQVVEMDSTGMLAAINQPNPPVQAISPDSRIWLNKQDAGW